MTTTQRDRLVRRGLWLAAATITWNVIEAVVAISAGVAAGSLALVAFGFDSIIALWEPSRWHSWWYSPPARRQVIVSARTP